MRKLREVGGGDNGACKVSRMWNLVYIKMNELRFWRSIGNLALALRPATRISGARVLLLRSALPTRFVYNFIILVNLIHSFLLLVITAAAKQASESYICLQDSFIHSFIHRRADIGKDFGG